MGWPNRRAIVGLMRPTELVLRVTVLVWDAVILLLTNLAQRGSNSHWVLVKRGYGWFGKQIGNWEVLGLYRKRDGARRLHEHGVFARFRYNDLKEAARAADGGPMQIQMREE
jgi:hypothetical protein